jgi:succinate dehydrogenase hydrophobic membrane anchor protein
MLNMLARTGTGCGGSTAWVLQRISGLLLVVTLFLHYLFLHFLNDGNVTWQEVTTRLTSPLFKTIDLVFLVSVLFHAGQGIVINIHDYVHRPAPRVILVSLAWILMLTLLITGTVTIVTLEPAFLQGLDMGQNVGMIDVIQSQGVTL